MTEPTKMAFDYSVYYKRPDVLEKKRLRAKERWADPKERKKIICREITKMAVKTGELRRGPCASCGAKENIHAHHEDYTKPLSIIWFCRPCHTAYHRSKVKTCKRGHEFTEENTVLLKRYNGSVWRNCLICSNASKAEWWRKNKSPNREKYK